MATVHQGVFHLGELVFFSEFDSGNLVNVERRPGNWVKTMQFDLWLGADASDIGHSAYRVWFYFGVRGLNKSGSVRFTVMNFSGMRSLFGNRYKIVWSVQPAKDQWSKLPFEIGYEALPGNNARISWDFEAQADGLTHYFAFAYPYTIEKLNKTLTELASGLPASAYYHRETLIRSLQGRNIDLLTITDKGNVLSDEEESLPSLFPSGLPRARRYLISSCRRPVVFITSRVHPGETVASYMLDGVLRALLHPSDKRSQALRSQFVFKIIPMLNPDGVYHGNFRLDVNGVNLNRCYIAPEREKYPAVYGVKTYIEYLHCTTNLFAYFDFHGHASKRGCFLFGNALPFDALLETRVFTRLVHLNSTFFEYSECDFSERSMLAKDPKDEHSKEGSGRVSIYRSTGLVHSYTVECNANIGRLVHALTPLVNTATGKRYSESPQRGKVMMGGNARERGIPAFEEVGAGLVWALLDIKDANPYSRLPSSDHMSLQGLRDWVKESMLLEPRARSGIRRLKSTGPNSDIVEEENKQKKVLMLKHVTPGLNVRFPSLLQAGSRRSLVAAPNLPKPRYAQSRI